MLIFAGAGSGKTRVLTYRVAYLIREMGVSPAHILAVTFTNKAAKEMKERISKIVGPLRQEMWIGTFHSLSARMLRIHGEKIGLNRDFVIYDEGDQEILARDCLRELNIDEKRYSPRAVLGAISHAKERLTSPEAYANGAHGAFERVVAEVYPLYVKKLRRNEALDFDDLIAFAVQLLRESVEVREQLQERFQHVLVDEFQDINQSQYAWTRAIAAKHRNIMVVGDDDQSIYSWRGADVGLILAFEKDYPGAHVIKLEQNYRSSANILEAAHCVVQRNRTRAEKRLWTDKPAGRQITVHQAVNEYEEALYAVMKIREACATAGRKYKDFAILYRTNSQSRPFEDALRQSGVPYRMVGGLRFYDRKEVKDLLAYLRLIANPADSVSMRRVLNVPARGIGPTTLLRIEEYAGQRDISTFEAMRTTDAVPGIGPAIRQKIKGFVTLIEGLREVAQSAPVDHVLRAVVEKTGFVETLAGKTDVETQSRKENVQELLKVAQDFPAMSGETTLSAFLEQMALVSDVDNVKEDEDAVLVLTLHAAKGLEFPVVFIAGLEEGIFPHSRATSDEAIEEERRLCYVGITRAKEELHLLSAYRRTAWGSPQLNPPSRFLGDIPATLVSRFEVGARVYSWDHADPEPEEEPAAPPAPIVAPAEVEPPRTRPGFGIDVSEILAKNRPAPAAFTRGERVRHPKFGEGIILNVKGEGVHTEVSVHFGSVGTKKLMLEFARLSKA